MNPRPRHRSLLSRVCLLTRDAGRCGRPRFLAAAVAAAAVAGGASLGFVAETDAPAAPAGLAGLWPEFPPEALSVDSFARLGGKWEDWARDAAGDVTDLYSLRDESPDAQRAAVARVESRVRVLRKALSDPAYRSLWPDLNRIYGPLSRRAALADAALDVLATDARTAARPARQAASSEVRTALTALENDLRQILGGDAWRDYVRAEELRAALGDPAAARPLIERLPAKLAPFESRDEAQREFLSRPAFRTLATAANIWLAADRVAENGVDAAAVRGRLADLIAAIDLHDTRPTSETAGQIVSARQAFADAAGPAAAPLLEVLRVQYLNYNARLVADETFLSKLVAVHDIQCGPVRDCVKGATVRGTQQTTSDVALQLLPDPDEARFRFVLDGVANTRTNASTPQATVSSVGVSRFHATKPITFDGRRFDTDPAAVAVDPNIRHVGIATKYDGLFFGLFKGPIRREAFKRANAELPFSRRYAAGKLRENLLPEFDGAVDKNFADLNGELAGLNARAAKLGVAPSLLRTLTTDDRFLFDMVVRGGEEVAGAPPLPNATRGIGFTLQVHESLLNNAADRWGFAGRTMTGAEVQAEMEGWLSRLLGKPISFGQPDPSKPADPTRLIFADADPIKFRVSDGAIVLILRAGIEQPDGEDVPPQIVEVPLTLTVEADAIRIERGTVRVSPLGRPANRAVQITRAGVMRRKLEQSIEGGTRPRTTTIDREDRGPVTVNIRRIDAEAGWLTVYGS